MSDRARLHLQTIEGGEPPRRWILFLHGILGSGSNWAGFARRYVAARPGWGAVTVDLRLHGRSESGAPPHTVEAAARDVIAALAGRAISPRQISGHSFGSKVAFRVAELLETTPERVWLLDADPGPRPEAAGRSLVLRVIAALRELPREYERRDQFTDALVERGFALSLAGWLGKNLHRRGDCMRLEIDLDGIEAILEDYHRVDLWPRLPGAPFALSTVIGGRSDVFGPDARGRLEAAAESGILSRHLLPEAGHWVHIDAPKGLLEAFLADA